LHDARLGGLAAADSVLAFALPACPRVFYAASRFF
jgi:hypothetical protein